jgi:hypothetical protein
VDGRTDRRVRDRERSHPKKRLALLRGLSGQRGSPLPYAWSISEICREFGCLPSEAEAELARDEARDEPLLGDILDLRQFAEAKRAFEEAQRDGKTFEHLSPMMQELMRLEYELMNERHARPEGGA